MFSFIIVFLVATLIFFVTKKKNLLKIDPIVQSYICGALIALAPNI